MNTHVKGPCYEPPYDPSPSVPINLRFPRRYWWRRNLYWLLPLGATLAGFLAAGIFGAP